MNSRAISMQNNKQHIYKIICFYPFRVYGGWSVSYLLVRSDVEEQMRKLWSRILWTMRRREAENQHYRFSREILLRLSQEGHRVVSNQVGIVVLKTQDSPEISAIMGYYAAYSSKYWPKFQDNLSAPPSRVKNSKIGFLDLWRWYR